MVITVKLSCLSFLQKKSIFLYRKRRRKVKHLPPFKGGSSFLERDDLTFKKFRWDADFFLPLYYNITFYQRKSNKTWWEKWCCKSLGKCLLIYIYRHILEQHVTDIFHSPKKISKLILSIFFISYIIEILFQFSTKKNFRWFFSFWCWLQWWKNEFENYPTLFLPMLHKISFLTKQQEIMKQRLKNFMPSPIEWGFSFTYVLLFANRTLLYTRQLSPPQLMGAASLLSSLCLTHT